MVSVGQQAERRRAVEFGGRPMFSGAIRAAAAWGPSLRAKFATNWLCCERASCGCTVAGERELNLQEFGYTHTGTQIAPLAV